jgi:Flp pilus assembly pilin Flp
MKGQTIYEYVLILALMAIVLVGVVSLCGQNVKNEIAQLTTFRHDAGE